MAHSHTTHLKALYASSSESDDDLSDFNVPLLPQELKTKPRGYGSTHSLTALPPIFKRNQRRQRYVWIKVMLYSLAVFTKYMGYDTPAAIATDMKAAVHLDNAQMGLMFSLYSMPNVVLPFVFGVLTAHGGSMWGAVLLTVVVGSGSLVLFFFGAVSKQFWVLCVARLLYGTAVESFFVGGDALLSRWLDPSQLTFGFGVRMAAGELGSLITYYASPVVVKTWGWESLVGFNAVLSAVSSIGMFIAFRFDRSRYRAAVASHRARHPPVKAVERLKDAYLTLWQIPAAVWRLGSCIVLFQTGFYVFCAFGPNFFHVSYHSGAQVSNSLAGELSAAALLLSPATGALMDRYGHQAKIVCVAFAFSTLSLFLLASNSLHVSPWVLMSVFSVCYSVIPNALWAELANSVEERHFPVVYGLIASLANAVTAVAQLAVGNVSKTATVESYRHAMWILSGLLLLAFILSLHSAISIARVVPADDLDALVTRHSFHDHGSSTLLAPQERPSSPTSIPGTPTLDAMWDALPTEEEVFGPVN